MNWVHCNNCYVQPGQVDGKKFVITNCAHIFCLDCTLLPSMKQCCVCQVVYKTMPLSSKMSKDVEAYFRDPIDELQKQVKVLEFQREHRSRLAAHQSDALARCEALRKENAALRDEIVRSHEERERLRAEVTECRKRLEVTQDRYRSASHNGRPRSGEDSGYGGRGSDILKRPPEASGFFTMLSTKREKGPVFKTPAVMRTPGSHRSLQTGASNFSTPPTPIMRQTSDSSQKDPLHRRIRLPGDRGRPSPSMAASFHRLSLNKLTSTPKSGLVSKYSQYFNQK